ncbi:MAG: hypothetical protein ACRDZW_06285 [Acidimicrobiales bacterium]
MIPTTVWQRHPWPSACEADREGPCASPAVYTVAVEDSHADGSDIVNTSQTCGFHLQDAVDDALDLPVPVGVVDADGYLTEHERRVTVARWVA